VKKRILIAAGVAVIIGALMVAMAASLGGITSDDLGADDAVVASCDSNGVTTSYSVSYTTTGSAGYKVGDVTVGGIADPCDGATMSVTLTGSGGTSLGQQSVTVDVDSATSDTSDTVSFAASNTLAESVTGVHVVIDG
jgi:hypothetical protein